MAKQVQQKFYKLSIQTFRILKLPKSFQGHQHFDIPTQQALQNDTKIPWMFSVALALPTEAEIEKETQLQF